MYLIQTLAGTRHYPHLLLRQFFYQQRKKICWISSLLQVSQQGQDSGPIVWNIPYLAASYLYWSVEQRLSKPAGIMRFY